MPIALPYASSSLPARLARAAWVFVRQWVIPAVLIGLAAMLTVPWAWWVIYATYERATNERAAALAQRVLIQVSGTSAWTNWGTPDKALDPLKAELLGDPSVQAVCFLDLARAGGGFVRRSDTVPVPKSMDEIKLLMAKDAADSYRRAFIWPSTRSPRWVIYVDLSRAELRRHFKEAYWPLLKRVVALTAAGFFIISAVCIFAYRLYGRATRQRKRAVLEQQGLMAERVLTAAVLAHEIRNPLAALRFQLHSLRRNSDDPSRVGATADTIDSELSRIQQLVQDYLAHEKAQAMRVMPVDLGDAVHTLRAILDEMLRQSATRLVVHNAVGRLVVACDPHALRQVLMNLVLNAQQAMGVGGLITITIGREETYGTISVADTGPGIPPELRERIFKPFVTSKKDGSGIGLALVKRFVDNFGGSVTVDSTPGAGATFRLKLPLQEAAENQGNLQPATLSGI